MRFAIWNAAQETDKSSWLRAWSHWREREVFAHPSYVQLYRHDGDEAICAAWVDGDVMILYPFLLRRVGPYNHADQVDIITPYGYGGPFCSGKLTDEVAGRFWASFDAWAHARGVVSEFVRFSLFQETLVAWPGNRIPRSVNIVRSLDVSDETMWQEAEYKVRKNVKRARFSGIRIEADPEGAGFSNFMDIYYQTMNRRSALSSYYFPEAYFRSLHENLMGSFMYFHAFLGDKVIASELVLVSNENCYSFLGGTDEHYFDHRPNDLLKYEIFQLSREMGKRRFVLGGGYEPGDGIFRYKRSFAPNGQVEFHVGTRILNEPAYNRLIQDRKEREPEWQPRPDFFPIYRA